MTDVVAVVSFAVEQTFPRAIDEVAISNWKLSPSFPGAATAIGFVPIDG